MLFISKFFPFLTAFISLSAVLSHLAETLAYFVFLSHLGNIIDVVHMFFYIASQMMILM